MKRVLSFILALTMTLTLCACGSGSGKLSPYLMDFQFGAGEEATEKTILDLKKNDTFTVNGIEFSSVSADYSDGYMSGIQYTADDVITLGGCATSSDNPDIDVDVSLAETTVSDLVEKYNQAYAILVKSFGKPDKGNTAEQLLTQEDFEMYYTSNDVSALWYYNGHTIILKAEGTIGTYSQPITDYALVSYFRYLIPTLTLSITDHLE